MFSIFWYFWVAFCRIKKRSPFCSSQQTPATFDPLIPAPLNPSRQKMKATQHKREAKFDLLLCHPPTSPHIILSFDRQATTFILHFNHILTIFVNVCNFYQPMVISQSSFFFYCSCFLVTSLWHFLFLNVLIIAPLSVWNLSCILYYF